MNIDDLIVTDYPEAPLPVTLLRFEVMQDKSQNILNFSTASEINNDYFSIERSGDGRSFEELDRMDGAGNSSELRHYSYTDERPLSGLNYYRIKQTDYNGEFSYSPIRSLRHIDKSQASVFPTLTSGDLHIATESDDYQILIFNSAGQKLRQFSGLSGNQTLDVSTLQAGVYFLRRLNGHTGETIKIVKW